MEKAKVDDFLEITKPIMKTEEPGFLMSIFWMSSYFYNNYLTYFLHHAP